LALYYYHYRPSVTKFFVSLTLKYRSRLSEIEAKSAEDDEEDDSEAESSDESWNSEDDPDRLWCICKKPHNNRFMICCDLCEDWFHGKCVGITKSMGMLPVHFFNHSHYVSYCSSGKVCFTTHFIYNKPQERTVISHNHCIDFMLEVTWDGSHV
jgi:hypothetical protein